MFPMRRRTITTLACPLGCPDRSYYLFTEPYPRLKELRIVGDHEISEVWQDDLAPKVNAILDEKRVDWSTTDVVRIGYVGEPSGNVVLWIGANPDSLSYEFGIDAALECKMLLLNYGINDVDLEIRQSKIIQSSGPQLFQPIDPLDPVADVRIPFTATLGTTICSRLTPWTEGTAGFFLDEGGDDKRLLLATATLSFPNPENKLYECKPESQASQDRHDVLVLSEASFEQHLVFIKDQIKAQDVAINYHTKRIEKMADREDRIAI
jgi:hypothetical protein